MAGSQDPSDNPVAVNVVPLVDIIFCLCVFFMCSFKFRQLEGKFDSWLPKDRGVPGTVAPLDLLSETRVALTWDEVTGQVVRKLGLRTFRDDAALEQAVAQAHDAFVRAGRPDAPVTIDADSRVPWSEVVRVVNLVRRLDVHRIEFAAGAPPAPRESTR